MQHKRANPDSTCQGTLIPIGSPGRRDETKHSPLEHVTFQQYRCLTCSREILLPVENIKRIQEVDQNPEV